jgi:dihydrofolate reductase
MMESYWPTPAAAKNAPRVADGMNRRQKLVFSRTLSHVSWSNTHLVKGDLVTEVRRWKEEPGDPIVILGSGSIVTQLAEARLVDEYQVVIHPVALGKGRPPATSSSGISPPPERSAALAHHLAG